MQPGGRQRRGASGGVSILYLPGRPPKCPRPRQPVVFFFLIYRAIYKVSQVLPPRLPAAAATTTTIISLLHSPSCFMWRHDARPFPAVMCLGR